MAAAMTEGHGSPDFEHILVPDIEIKTEGEDSENSQSAISGGDVVVTDKTPKRKSHPRTELKHPCVDCGKKFRTRVQLDKHSIIHSNKTLFQCSQCPKVFRQKGHLTFHITEVHCGDKIYNCPKCDKKFSILDKLQYHIENVHDKVKPYVCPHCEKAFIRKFNLSCHLNSKKGKCGLQNKIKPFACPHCDKAFERKYDLNCHMTSFTGCRETSLDISTEEGKDNPILPPSIDKHRHEMNIEINTDEYDNKGLNLIKTDRIESVSIHTKKPIPALKRFLRNKSSKTLPKLDKSEKDNFISEDRCDISVMNVNSGGILANLLLSRNVPQINRKFQCCVCNLNFSILSDLKIHEEVHLCQLCGGIFSNLEFHISQVHFGSENGKCKQCKHLTQCVCVINIGKQFSCIFCNHMFTHKLDLDNHLKSKHNSIQDFSELKDKLSLNNYEENMTKFMKEFLLPAQNECKKDLLKFFSCHSCRQGFTNLNDLQHHISVNHSISSKIKLDDNVSNQMSNIDKRNERNSVCESGSGINDRLT